MTSKSNTPGKRGTNISCQELESLIVDYLDDQLAEQQRSVFDLHLASCPACQTYLANYKEVLSASQKAYSDVDEQSCEKIPEALVQTILAAKKK